MEIRNIRISDLPALAEIYIKVSKQSHPEEKWTTQTANTFMEYWLERQPDLCFLAELDGKIVGAFVAAIKPWWDGNHLVDGEIFIDPEHQNKGIEKPLSKYMYEAALLKYEVVRIETSTFKISEFPLSWYKSQGFEELKNWSFISADLKEILRNYEKV